MSKSKVEMPNARQMYTVVETLINQRNQLQNSKTNTKK